MVKKAKNIYDYYREQEVKDLDEERVQPLENNTTKALINTLENCSPELTQKLFKINRLDIELNKNLHYFLQTQPTTLSEKLDEKNIDIKEVYVVGISENDELYDKPKKTSNSRKNSIPDALIFDDRVMIAIEVKTKDDILESTQLENHLAKCKDVAEKNSKSNKEYLRWNEISEFLRNFVDENSIDKDKDSFLINQFVEYLKVNNMTKFTSFDRDLLELEGRPRALKEQLSKLIERLKKNLPDEYSLTHSRSELATWDYLSYDDVVDRNYKIPHITLSLQPNEFQIKIHVRGNPKKHTHIKYMYNLSSQELDEFINHLHRIHNSFSENEFENKNKIPKWYDKDEKPKGHCIRPIRLKLDGRKGGSPKKGNDILCKYRVRRELGIVYKDDLNKARDFMNIELKDEHNKEFNFQIMLNYPYSDSIGILTGEVGRNFYEEAKKDIEILYPLFDDIKEKSL